MDLMEVDPFMLLKLRAILQQKKNIQVKRITTTENNTAAAKDAERTTGRKKTVSANAQLQAYDIAFP